MLRPLGAGAERPGDRPDVAGPPGRLGGQAPAARGLPGPPRLRAGTTTAWRPWTSSTTTCGRRGRCSPGWTPSAWSTTRPVAAAVTEPPRRTRAWFRGECLKRWPASVVTANWDSLVFDLGADPLRRVPMMDPLKGTAEHVEDTVGRVRESGRAGGPTEQLRTSGRRSGAMAERELKKKAATTERADEAVEEVPAASAAGEKLKAELDDLLDEIDEVLEDNAEEFVRNYVQKGGRVAARDAAALLDHRGPGPGLRRADPSAAGARAPAGWPPRSPARARPSGFRHGTTVVALRFADGVVMAGDRRATEGHAIAHRAMEKVFPADRYSAVAIAGAAGPAVEMVRLFQTQLEHYEKVEGVVLSLEGKANQLGQMVREHLPMAMQGLAVVPLFAGYDLARGHGPDLHLRRHRRPLRGDRAQRHRVGWPRRPHHHQAGLPGRDWRATRPWSWPSSRSTRRPTRTRPPAGPT